MSDNPFTFVDLLLHYRPGVLKSKYEDIARVLLGLLETGNLAEDAQVARPILFCLGTLLAALDTPTLGHKNALQMFQAQNNSTNLIWHIRWLD